MKSKLKNSAVFLIFTICLFLFCCRSGSTSAKWCFFPNSAKPEDNWQGAVAVRISSDKKHFSEKEPKKCSITVYDRDNKILYFEKMDLDVSIPREEISWSNYDEIEIKISDDRGFVLLSRKLEMDHTSGLFKNAAGSVVSDRIKVFF